MRNGGDAPRCKQTGHPRRRRIKIVLPGSDQIPKLDTDALYPRCKHRGIAVKNKEDQKSIDGNATNSEEILNIGRRRLDEYLVQPG